MSYPLAAAEPVARHLIAVLAPFCHRIEIAGSIRRRKPIVGDIEIVFIPRVEQRMADMFATAPADLSAEEINRWLAAGEIQKRPGGGWGPLNKLGVYQGMNVDLFAEPNPEDWWRSLVIRTGPKDLNVRLIMSAAKRGLHVHAYGVGITDARQRRVPCTCEEDFFRICGVPWASPEERH